MESILHVGAIDLAEYVRLKVLIMDLSVELLTRATLLLALGILISQVMRRFSAGVRHALWSAVFVMLLLIPMVMIGGARWELPVLPASTYEGPIYEEIVGGEASTPQETEKRIYVGAKPYYAAPHMIEVPVNPGAPILDSTVLLKQHPLFEMRGFNIFVLTWMVGFLVSLISIGVGKVRWSLLVRRAEPLLDPDWHDTMESLKKQLGVYRDVRLLTSKGIATPMTGGSLFPVILVPDSSLTWSAERTRVVLAHELIHVKRYDAFRSLLSRLALGMFWFHPLSWIASQMATTCMEKACDEKVLALGTKPSSYAQELMRMAERMTEEPSYAYLPMIRKSQLEQRLLSILNPKKPIKNMAMSMMVFGATLVFGIVAVIAHPVEQKEDRSEPVIGVISEPVVILEEKLAKSELAREPVIVIRPREPKEQDSEPVLVVFPKESPVIDYTSRFPLIKGVEGDVIVLSDTSELRKIKAAPVAAVPSPSAAPINPDEFICEVPFGGGKEMKHNFYGSLTTLKDDDGKKYEYSGEYNSTRVTQIYRDGIRLCMRTKGNINITEDGLIKIWRDDNSGIRSEKWVVLEAEDDKLYKMIVHFEDNGKMSWTIDGEEHEFDEEATAWMNQMTSIFRNQIELGSLNNQTHKLQEKVASMKMQQESLRDEMAAHRSKVKNMVAEVAELKQREKWLLEQGALSNEEDIVQSFKLQAQLQDIEAELKKARAQQNGLDADENTEKLKEYKRLIEEMRAKLAAEIEASQAERHEKEMSYYREAEEIRKRILELQSAFQSQAVFDSLRVDGVANQLNERLASYQLNDQIAKITEEIRRLNSDKNSADLEKEIDKKVRELKKMMRRY